MIGRTRGVNYAGSGLRAWAGTPNEFRGWSHFREWSLKNGYSKINRSLDREDDLGPYSPDNCRWTTVEANTAWQNICKYIRDVEDEARCV